MQDTEKQGNQRPRVSPQAGLCHACLEGCGLQSTKKGETSGQKRFDPGKASSCAVEVQKAGPSAPGMYTWSPPPPNVSICKLFVRTPGTLKPIFFNRAPNLGLKKLLFEPWVDTHKKIMDVHIKKRAKRGISPYLDDFWPFGPNWWKPSALWRSLLGCNILQI